MSSRRGRKHTGSSRRSANKHPPDSSICTDGVVAEVAHTHIHVPQQVAGDWETIASKSNKTAGAVTKQWTSQPSQSRSWGQPVDAVRGSAGSKHVHSQVSGSTVNHSQQTVFPPLQSGWDWKKRGSAVPSGVTQGERDEHSDNQVNEEEDTNDVFDVNIEDDEEDDLDDDLSDDIDSDTSPKSHEVRIKSKWFKNFFESLNKLSLEEINKPERQWHCPACKGGPGAIDWYVGLQPLMRHAETKRADRAKLHREFVGLLEEELCRRGTSVIQASKMFGKWKGLKEEEKDREIVWPPMVVIMNTRLEMDENDKWIGMGNQELLEYFSMYPAVKARHSYGPSGHRGMSVLIFEGTARGYFEAERLHKHFIMQNTDRNAWDSQKTRTLFLPGGKRQLYGYMARKEDLDNFNQHSQGKARLKFDMRSYHEMVVKQIQQMAEDNQQLVWLKDKVDKEKMHAKALEESFGVVTETLRRTMEEKHIVRKRTQMHHEQNKEELDFQEQFFKEQIRIIHERMTSKEEDFEKLQLQKCQKMQQNPNPPGSKGYSHRLEEVEKFAELQDQEMEEFMKERDRVTKEHQDKIAAMRRRHWEEEISLEKEFDAELTSLMEKYTPH